MLTKGIQSQIQHSNREINRLALIRKQPLPPKHDAPVAQHFFRPRTNPLDKMVGFISLSTITLPTETAPPTLHPPTLHPVIQCVHQVYKLKYLNGEATGLGDFIRGCYHLMQFCERRSLACDFHIYDSCLKHYLPFFREKPALSPSVANQLQKHTHINASFAPNEAGVIEHHVSTQGDHEFVAYLNRCHLHPRGHVFAHSILFPQKHVSKEAKERMKTMLTPAPELVATVDRLLAQWGMAAHQSFHVFHVRIGDSYLANQSNAVQEQLARNLVAKMATWSPRMPCVLLSDSVSVRRLLCATFPQLLTLEGGTSHILANDEESVRQTVLEFHLMSRASSIVSFSVYPHGSGFSKWCAFTYGIPYVCYYLP